VAGAQPEIEIVGSKGGDRLPLADQCATGPFKSRAVQERPKFLDLGHQPQQRVGAPLRSFLPVLPNLPKLAPDNESFLPSIHGHGHSLYTLRIACSGLATYLLDGAVFLIVRDPRGAIAPKTSGFLYTTCLDLGPETRPARRGFWRAP